MVVTEEEEGQEIIFVVGGNHTRSLKKNLPILKEGEETLTTTVIISRGQLTCQRFNAKNVKGMAIINQNVELT